MSNSDDDEPPTATTSNSQSDNLHDIEDEVQDWKLLGARTSATSAIPKRGEKEFEPDGTAVQNQSLQESQKAMFDALSNERGHHIKHKLIGVWVPKLNQCLILQIRGNFFRDMGVAHGTIMYLNIYETVYLVERGSLIAYLSNKEFEEWMGGGGAEFDIENKLWALDLEYLYCLTKVDISQYQVYSYLKRLGYILQTPSSTPAIEKANVCNATMDVSFWLLPREWGLIAYPVLHTCHFKTKSYFNYTSIYKAITLNNDKITTTTPKEQLQITYNIWRPTPSFAKKSPPPPDFQLVVIDSSKDTSYMTLSEIQHLQQQLQVKEAGSVNEKKPPKKQPRVESKRQIRAKQQAERQSKLDKSIQLRNEYWKRRDLGFKQGSSPVIVAVVNQGVMNFINLSTGDFSCEFNKEALDEIYPGKAHSIIYHEQA
ncbi:SEN54 [Candida theae]|uniref:SEN54 n=1 Tax=Candida theae TaxID=1198502 RepID=A0AAD5BAB0_9ASCO|nr:SEN54 [Candida theae]KAI5948980.1 SEN54 [Candida theae]